MGFFTSHLTSTPNKPTHRIGPSGGGVGGLSGQEAPSVGKCTWASRCGAHWLKLKKKKKKTFQNINIHTESKNAMLPFVK